MALTKPDLEQRRVDRGLGGLLADLGDHGLLDGLEARDLLVEGEVLDLRQMSRSHFLAFVTGEPGASSIGESEPERQHVSYEVDARLVQDAGAAGGEVDAAEHVLAGQRQGEERRRRWHAELVSCAYRSRAEISITTISSRTVSAFHQAR